MSLPVHADDVAVGLLTENSPRMLTQAVRLLRSIRWFGGALAAAAARRERDGAAALGGDEAAR